MTRFSLMFMHHTQTFHTLVLFSQHIHLEYDRCPHFVTDLFKIDADSNNAVSFKPLKIILTFSYKVCSFLSEITLFSSMRLPSLDFIKYIDFKT